jgi:site-specific DNA recombinase
MRRYAAQYGFTVVAEFEEDYSGATPMRERPEGARLYELIDRGEVDVVIFYTLDRASREDEVIDLLTLKRTLKQAGIELHFCDTGRSDDSPLGGIMDYIRGAQAAEERKKIRERSIRGLREKSKEKWVGINAPYGYRKEGHKKEARLVIDEAEAAIVRRIFALYVGIGCEPATLHEIARTLTAEKAPSRRSAKGWHLAFVKRMIDSRAYVGEFSNYGGSVISLPELAIIDREVWKAAQRQRLRNKERAKRNRKHEYLLSGHLKCFCGGVRSGHTMIRASGTYVYYECGIQRSQRHLTTCRELDIRAEILDALAWGWMFDLMGSDENLRHGISRKRARDKANSKHKWERLGFLAEAIPEHERKIRNYLAAFGEEADPIVAAEVKATVKALSKQREAYIAEQERLEVELGESTISEAMEAEFLSEAAKLRAGMIDADFETKRYFLKRMDFQGKLRRDEGGKAWFDVSCGLTLESDSLPIDLPDCLSPSTDRPPGCCTRRGCAGR